MPSLDKMRIRQPTIHWVSCPSDRNSIRSGQWVPDAGQDTGGKSAFGMSLLHDPGVRDAIKNRVAALRADAKRQWGRMTVDQMLWHVNCGLENSLGRYEVKEHPIPLVPNALVKWAVLTLPWRRGKTPTAPEFVAKQQYDFGAEQARLLHLVDEVTSRPTASPWPRSSFMGEMSGGDWSRLHAKHLDHHLSQFGA